MATCKNCPQSLEQDWSFCPQCGVDNHPERHHPALPDCPHKLTESQKFCPQCGKPKYKTMSPRSAVKTMIAGLTLIGSALTIGAIHSYGQGPIFNWISSWYDVTYHSIDKYGRPETTQRGYMIVSITILIGIVTTAIGTASHFQNQSPD